jgi:bacteriocin-like protein
MDKRNEICELTDDELETVTGGNQGLSPSQQAARNNALCHGHDLTPSQRANPYATRC